MTNSNEKNLIHVEFESTIGINGYLRLNFPVTSHEGLDLLDEDFGSEL